jgi:hypothetical protein
VDPRTGLDDMERRLILPLPGLEFAIPTALSRHLQSFLYTKTKLNSAAFGPRANYADRATAASWRSSANFCG